MEGFIAGAVLGGAIGLGIGWVGVAVYRSLFLSAARRLEEQARCSDQYREMLGAYMHRYEPVHAVWTEWRLARRGLPPMLRAPEMTPTSDATGEGNGMTIHKGAP